MASNEQIGVNEFEAPLGFRSKYKKCAKDMARPNILADILGLIGYDVTTKQVEKWPDAKRIQLEVYACNVHLRASDNILRKHQKPDWLPEPWVTEKGTKLE
jgi:hypothetical protein